MATAGHHRAATRSRRAAARAAPSRPEVVPSDGSRAVTASRESATIGTSAGKPRTSCSGSRSTRISLPSKRSGCGSGYISVSPNSVPMASTTSAARSASRRGGQAMFSPACRGWPGGRMPLALTVLITGASSRSASATASAAAPAAPPPSTISGRSARARRPAARAMASGSGAGGRAGDGRPAAGRRHGR